MNTGLPHTETHRNSKFLFWLLEVSFILLIKILSFTAPQLITCHVVKCVYMVSQFPSSESSPMSSCSPSGVNDCCSDAVLWWNCMIATLKEYEMQPPL